MKTVCGFIGAAMASLAAVAAPSVLSVSFVHPENYTDGGYHSALPGEQDRAEVQRDIQGHLQKLAERGLPADAVLNVEVLDIDLAGGFEPARLRAGGDLRIVRNISYPRIKLRYTLTRAERVVASAEELLTDINYLTPRNRYPSGDPLRYEKAMLDRWFEERIGSR